MSVSTASDFRLADHTFGNEDRRNRTMMLAFVILILIYTYVILARPAGIEFSRTVGLVGKTAITFLIGGWSIFDGLFRRDGSRLSWQSRRSIPIVIGLSIVLIAIGDAFLSYRVLALHQASRSTSIADFIYLSAYPLILIGLLKMPVRPIPLSDRVQTVFDGLIAMTSLVTFSWFFFLGPALEVGVHSMYDRVIAAASPCCDLLMMFCILVVLFHPAERRLLVPVLLACCGISLSVAGNGLYLYLVAHSTSGINGILTPIWLSQYLFLGLAGMGASRTPANKTTPLESSELPARVLESNQRSPWRALAPYSLVPPLLVLIAFVLSHPETRQPLANGVFAGAAALILLIMMRQMLAILDHGKHSRLLHDAYNELRTTQDALEEQTTLLAQTNERLHRLATTDPLTGLANRRAFQDRIAEVIQAAPDGALQCGLLLLDVDNFKPYNDTYGHPAGDEVLKSVAALLRAAIPANGLAARYGGEEFAVLLPGMTYSEARAAAELLRRRIEGHAFPDRAVTVSVGVTCLNGYSGSEPTRLVTHAISAADAGLYRAKRAGRNRVVLSDELDS